MGPLTRKFAHLVLPAILGLAAATPFALAKTVIFVGGYGMTQAQADEWGRQFREKHPGVKVVALHGPSCIPYKCARGEQSLLNKINAAIDAAGEDEIDLIGHSSGTATVERVAYETKSRSRRLRVFNLDGFSPQPGPPGVKREFICVTAQAKRAGVSALLKAENHLYMHAPLCTRTHVIDLGEVSGALPQGCLHYRVAAVNACGSAPRLLGKFEIETSYWTENPAAQPARAGAPAPGAANGAGTGAQRPGT